MAERVRLVNRLRQLLWSCYPQLNELIGGAVRPWILELWELAPAPAAARRIRTLTVQKPLKHHRIRRVDTRGLGHSRSLRTVGDRLLRVACAMLEKGELFDKEFKARHQAAAA